MRGVLLQLASAEVEHPILAIEEVGVCIQLTCCYCYPLHFLRQTNHCFQLRLLLTAASKGEHCIAGIGIVKAMGFPGDGADCTAAKGLDLAFSIGLPLLAIPNEPLPPSVTVPNMGAKHIDKPFGISHLGVRAL